jgi:FkbM family methyltransferase
VIVWQAAMPARGVADGARQGRSCNVIDRIGWYINAQRRARRFGIPFIRRKGFKVPARITVNGQPTSILSPPEHGTAVDFIGLFLDDCYGLETIARRDRGPIRRVLDIGANVGWFSVAARSRFPDAAIHAYEPNPTVVPVLRRNVSALDVVVHPEAVGVTAGLVSIDVPSGESNLGRAVDGGGIRRVALTKALKRLGGGVDLVKLDCEGGEWPMFDDPGPWATIRWLAMEYHLWARRSCTHHDASQIVRQLGFEVISQRPIHDCGLMLARRVDQTRSA